LKVPILATILAVGVEAVVEDNVAVPFILEIAAVLVEVVERTETVESVGLDEVLVPFLNGPGPVLIVPVLIVLGVDPEWLVEFAVETGPVRGVESTDDTALVSPG
jgi:hypothetical protein